MSKRKLSESSSSESEEDDYQCQVCQKYCKDKRGLQKHINYVHRVKRTDPCGKIWSDGRKCMVTCSNKKKMTNHKLHHEPQECDHEDCTKQPEQERQFSDKLALDIHKNVAHGKTLRCKNWNRYGNNCRHHFKSQEDRLEHEEDCDEDDEDKSGPSTSRPIAPWEANLISLPLAIDHAPEIPPKHKILTFENGQVNIYYDYKQKGPKWVRQRLTKGYMEIDKPRSANTCLTRSEKKVPVRYQRPVSDFEKQDGFQSGHMAPDTIHSANPKLCWQLNKSSNRVLQLVSYNLGVWKDSEKEEWGFGKYHLVTYSYTGPLYTGEYEGVQDSPENPIASHFFRILLGQISVSGEFELKVFLIPHQEYPDKEKAANHYVKLEVVEELAKCTFFPGLDMTKVMWYNGEYVGAESATFGG